MAPPKLIIEDDDLWHPSGWSAVYDGLSIPSRLAGFTTLQLEIPTFLITREHDDPAEREHGIFLSCGWARRQLVGDFYAWVVEDQGAHRYMPDFWAV